MSFTIEDGYRGTRQRMGVMDSGRAMVDAETNLTPHFVSLDDGLAFNAVSIDAAAAAGDYILYFQNTSSSRLFFVDIIRVAAANNALWKVAEVTGTASGSSALTPFNMNLTSGSAAEATARGSGAVSGLTESSVIATVRSLANANAEIPFDDILILGENDAIAVEYDTGTGGAAEVLMRGYFRAK